jgi:Uma2 family endonuclease
MSANSTSLVIPEEYLEREFEPEDKSTMRPTLQHAMIVTNVAGELRQRVKGKPCRVYSSQVRLRLTPAGLYTCPDAMVVCGNVEFAGERKDTVLNPVAIMEVLSTSRHDPDRGTKFGCYRRLPSLIDFLTIAQLEPFVEHWARQADNRWTLTEFSGLGHSIQLPSIDCTLSLTEIYDRIDFTTTADLN